MIDKYALWEKIGYTPHSGNQTDAHESDARFKIVCCGRRWGKTVFGARELLPKLFEPDKVFWIVGPNYRLGEKEFRIIYRDLFTKLKLGGKLKASYNVKQGDMRIEFPWGTVVEVVSADNKTSLVGEGLDGVIMSEAAKHNRDTWEMYIEPALSDKRGFAIFPSTPQGYNWYYGMYQLGTSSMPGYTSWRFPSWTNPIAFPGGRFDPEILRIEATVSEHFFSQEYGAEFSTFQGKIYADEWNPNIHVTPIKYDPALSNYNAVDFGFAAPFVCLDIMVDTEDNVYVWREYQERYKTTADHALYLKVRPNPEGYHFDGIYCDPRGAEGIATLNQILGKAIGRDVPWATGIEEVKRFMKKQPNGKPKLFIDPSCTELIRQIENLRVHEEHRDGKDPREGQVDYDDHGPDALRYFFSEHYVLGARVHLADVYSPAYVGSEAETFFKANAGFTLAGSQLEF